MPDITMCEGGDCPLKKSCYRFSASADPDQTYFSKPPFREDGNCQFYWEVNDTKSKHSD